MARIRSIKPEFCTSEAIAALSIPCRLHFAMLWTYADDHGRGLDNPRLIKAALWPLDDDVDVNRIERWQQELADGGRLIRYEAEGRLCFQITNWKEHQHPQKPKDSAIPEAPHEGTRTVRDADRTPLVSVPSVVVEEGRVEEQEQEPSRLTKDERNERIDAAVEVLLLRDGSVEAAKTKTSPSRWLASARRGRRDDHRDNAHKLLVADASLTAEQLAEQLEPALAASGWVTCDRCGASVHPNSPWGHDCITGSAS